MTSQPSRDSNLINHRTPDAMTDTNNESLKNDELEDATVSREEEEEEEGDSIAKRNEEALIKTIAIESIRIGKPQRCCSDRINSSSSSIIIKRPLPKRAASEPPVFWPKSIMFVRTNDESLKRRTLRHHHRQKISSSDRKCNDNVAFITVQVQEYPITRGDNPSVSSGPPLTIDWAPLNSRTYDIDKYEELRQPYRRHSSAALAISHSQRCFILLRMGSTPREVYECQELAAKEREKRLKCLSIMSFLTFGIQARMELARRGMKNVILRGRKVDQRRWIEKGLESDREAFKIRSAIFHCDDCDGQSCKDEMDDNDGDARRTDCDRTNPLKITAISSGSSSTNAKAVPEDVKKQQKIFVSVPRHHFAKSA
uniref:Uncharacterized protein n=1 Tax=Helicotheca tamesis TaxID=374047 RepID=A0A7S2I068_9STRA|mmetsp:Transcript_4260/g.5806  ORF Transcript_4260/g.5806 Transcript_4260/m.5806 type:complete len:369 (+) Transcript_4260:87-1193(+)